MNLSRKEQFRNNVDPGELFGTYFTHSLNAYSLGVPIVKYLTGSVMCLETWLSTRLISNL